VVGDSLYAAGTYDDQGGQLVRIDADAMVSVMDLRGGYSAAWLTAVGNSLYFSAYAYGVDGEWLGREIWRIDPVSGSPRVIDLWPGSNGSDPRDLVDVQGTLYFIARREENGIGLGEELYRIDPITDQVELLADIYNGSGSSNPTNLTLSNGNLYFAATDILHGLELWRVQLNAAGSGIELSRSLAEDSILVFTADDFAIPFAAGGGGTLQAIQILSLPINGQLQLNGVASTINQIIPISSIVQLSFVPNADYNGSAGFNWAGSNGSGFASLPSLVTLTVTPVADAPRLQQPLLDRSIYSNRTDGYTFDVNTFRDPDLGQALTYSATLADGAPLPEWIRLNGRSFSFNPLPDAVGQYSIRVAATDPDGFSSLATADPGSIFNLQVINAAPQSLHLSDSRIDENSGNGTVVGAFTVIDPNSNDRHTLALLDSADGRFGLSGSPATGYNLVVADGSRLDFEAATSHQIQLLVTDETGLTLEQTFAIDLNNLPDSAAGNLTFSSANFSIQEDGQAVLPVTINRVGGCGGQHKRHLTAHPRHSHLPRGLCPSTAHRGIRQRRNQSYGVNPNRQ
jgi:ELWxxDGT repeat protein